MKKNLFSMVALLALFGGLVACNNQSAEELQRANGEVAFRITNDFARTRGAEVRLDDIQTDGFKVWAQESGAASMFMDNIDVRHHSGKYWPGTVTPAGFTPASYYWPSATTTGGTAPTVKFWAIYNNYSGAPTVNTTTQQLANFKPADSHNPGGPAGQQAMTDLQKDLVMAYNEGSASNRGGHGASLGATDLNLNFRHALSQIEFKAHVHANANFKVRVAGVSIHNLNGEGTVNFQSTYNANPTWASTTSAGTHYDNLGSGASPLTTSVSSITARGGAGNGSNFMVIPQTIQAYSATNTSGAFARVWIQVRNLADDNIIYPEPARGGGAVTSTNQNMYDAVDIPLTDITWAAGMKYIYTIQYQNGIGNIPFTQPIPNPNPGTTPTPQNPTTPVAPNPTPTPALGDPITFSVTVETWTDQPQTTITL